MAIYKRSVSEAKVPDISAGRFQVYQKPWLSAQISCLGFRGISFGNRLALGWPKNSRGEEVMQRKRVDATRSAGS